MERPTIFFMQPELGWTRSLRVDLRRRGAIVVAVTSTAELLHQAMRLMPDLIVLDADSEAVPVQVLMGVVHRQLPKARTILIHSKATGGLTSMAAEVGVVAQMEKPVHVAGIKKRVEEFCGERLAAEPSGKREPPLVLCVDDDPLYLESLKRLLTANGYRVETSADPEAALDSIPTLDPSLAILDIKMPGLNGLNLAEELLESYRRKIPVVMLTALGSDEEIADGYKKGVSFYLTKPCEPRKVLDVVDYLVGDLDPTERELLAAEL